MNTQTARIVKISGAVALLIVGILVLTYAISEKGGRQSGIDTAGTGVSSHSGQKSGLVGSPLPAITLTDAAGDEYPLESFKGKKTVLFFNEGLMCYPACWNQMAAFGNDARFNSDTVAVFSIVVDRPEDWQTAVEKMPALAEVRTLFDLGASSSRTLGILSLGSSMHPGQFPGHTYILLDEEGIVREVFDDPAMGVNNDLVFDMMSRL